jgi:selenocysteine lyase/cysteine desulfurase
MMSLSLNFAAHAAIPRVALNALRSFVAAKVRPHIVDDQSFFSVAASLRETVATLIEASSDEIALTSGSGAGLATIACPLKWSVGDEVVIACSEFPMQYATWNSGKVRINVNQRFALKDAADAYQRPWKRATSASTILTIFSSIHRSLP